MQLVWSYGEGLSMKRKNEDSCDDKSKKKKEQTHETQEETKPKENATCSMQEPENIAFIEEVTFENVEDDVEDYNYDMYNPSEVYANDDCLSHYDWLTNTATTAFITFYTINLTAVTCVSSIKAQSQGRGNVELKSIVDRKTYLSKLEDVLYVPTIKHNLISLGCWDKAGGQYMGGRGVINLVTKNGTHIVMGNKINNNLYKMQTRAYHCKNKSSETLTTFLAEEPAQSWDIWHKCLGRIGFSTLQNMLDKNLVNSFHVDEHTMKSDCRACTEAK